MQVDNDRWDRIEAQVWSMDLSELLETCVTRKLLTDDCKMIQRLRSDLANDLALDHDEPPTWLEDYERERSR